MRENGALRTQTSNKTHHKKKKKKKSWKQEILKWWEAQHPKLDAEVEKLGQGLLSPKPEGEVSWGPWAGKEEEEEDIYVGCKIVVIDFLARLPIR